VVEKILVDEGTLGKKINEGGPLACSINRVVVLQPSYLPWIGYFEQIARADQFVFLDDVQFTRRDWRNRNKIRTREGWAWLTVPIEQKNRYTQMLKETRIDNSTNWNKKHCESIRLNYSRAPFFEMYYPYFDSVYRKRWEFLLDLCYETTGYLKETLNITTPTSKSSNILTQGAKADLILNLCQQMGATHYLTGVLAKDYLSEKDFFRQGINLEYQKYDHPKYSQRYPGFVPYLSSIDLLFNVGDQCRFVMMNLKTKQS